MEELYSIYSYLKINIRATDKDDMSSIRKNIRKNLKKYNKKICWDSNADIYNDLEQKEKKKLNKLKKRLENVLSILKKKVFDIDDFKELKSFYKRLIKFTQEFKYEEVKDIWVYTDGSCINNGRKNSRAGIGVYFEDDQYHDYNVSIAFKNKPTNQRAELTAIQMALENIDKIEKENVSFIKVHIVSDSDYSIKCLSKWVYGWIKNDWKTKKKKNVKNKKIIKSIFELIESKYKDRIEFIHVNSHREEPINKDSKEWRFWYGNKQADIYACEGIKK